MRRVILLGPPGSGKGTQAVLLAEQLGVPAIATGDMLREALEAGTEAGQEAAGYMRRGELVPDAAMIRLISQRLEQPDAAHGFVLDGFPRTIAQAEALDEAVAIDHVVELRCDPETIVERMAGRRIHQPSGRVYHLAHSPPQRDGCDDVTGEPLTVREDDRPEVVRERLRVYEAKTAPLSGYYASAAGPQLHAIEADRPIGEVTAAIAAALA